MNTAQIVGIIFIVLGVIPLLIEGIEYTTEETIVDAGPLEMRAETEEQIPLPAILGVVSIVGGVILVAVGSQDSWRG